MLQKTKSMLTKLLMLLCVVCCAVALAFGLAGCSGLTVDHMELRGDELWVVYSDGSEVNLGNVAGEPSDEKTVVDVTYDAATGVVTIYYSDDTTETFTVAPGDDETCEHANVNYLVLNNEPGWTCEDGGEVLEVCNDCGAAHILYVTEHNTEMVTVPADCMNDGYDVEKCVICGTEVGERTNFVESTGEHDFDHENYSFKVAYPDKTLCEGGWIIYPCTYNCGVVEYEDIKAPGHTVSDWETNPAPTGSEKGEAVGYCSVCGERVTIELPELDKEGLAKYEYTVDTTGENFNCAANRTAHFTYVDEESGTTVEFDGTLPGTDHTLNGELFDADVEHVYASAAEIPEGLTIPINVNNGEPVCDEDVSDDDYAFFTCEVCHNAVAVRIRIAHTQPGNPLTDTLTYEEISSYATITDSDKDGKDDTTGLTAVETAAKHYVTELENAITAETANAERTVYYYAAACGGANGAHQGFRVYWCSECEDVVTDTIATPAHTFTYTSEVDAAEETVTITAACSVCKTTAQITLSDYTVDVRTEADCENDGVTVYTGKLVGEVAAVNPIFADFVSANGDVRITAVTPKTNHIHPIYDDEFITDPDKIAAYEAENGVELVYYIEDYPDMDYAINSSEDCGDGDNVVFAYFTCEDCGGVVYVNMKHKHEEPTVSSGNNIVDMSAEDYDPSDYTYNTNQTVTDRTSAEAYLTSIVSDTDNANYNKVFVMPATCDNPGSRTYICANCGEVTTDEIAKLGHAWSYDVVVGGTQTEPTYTLHVSCANCKQTTLPQADAPEGYTHVEKLTPVTGLELPMELKHVYDSASKVPETPTYPYMVRTTTSATCAAPAVTTYVIYTAEDAAPITVRETGETVEHMLDGQRIDDSRPVDPAEYGDLITIAVNYPSSCDSDKLGVGFFTCEDCGETVMVWLRGSHKVPTAQVDVTDPENEVTIDWNAVEALDDNNDGQINATELGEDTIFDALNGNVYYIDPASCTVTGNYLYFCSVCEDWIYDDLPATGHDYSVYSYEMDDDFTFTVKFMCANEQPSAPNAAPVTKEVKVDVLDVTDTLAISVKESVDEEHASVVFTNFVPPTHATYGNFTLTYTMDRTAFVALLGGKEADYPANFQFVLTLSGSLSTKSVEIGGEDYHYHLAAPVYGQAQHGDGWYYWYVDTTNEETGVVTRTYYQAKLCTACGVMHSSLQQADGLTAGAVSGDKIPESTNPIYSEAVAEDDAAEEEAPATEEAA